MKKRSRWLACLLCLALALTLLPTAALAEGQTHEWNGADDISWEGVQNGDTVKLGASFTGVISVPKEITSLTVDGQGYELTGTSIVFDVALKLGEAAGETDLKIRNLKLVSAADQYGITLPGNSRLTVEGVCSVLSGAERAQYTENGYGEPSAIACTGLDDGSFSLLLEPGSALTVRGGDNLQENKYGGHGIVNRCYNGEMAVTVGEGAVLQVAGGNGSFPWVTCGLTAGGAIVLNNSGTASFYTGTLADGTPAAYGVLAGSGGLTVAGAGMTIAWGYQGLSSSAPGLVVIEEEARGLSLGTGKGLPNSAVNNSSSFYGLQAMLDGADYSGGLDLTEVAESTFYPGVGGGFALWQPGAGEETAKLTLYDVSISGEESGLTLPCRNVELNSLGHNTLMGRRGVSVDLNAWTDKKTLTIRGSGMLAADGGEYGISAAGEIVLLEGELRATGQNGALEVRKPQQGGPSTTVGGTVTVNPTTLTPTHYGEAKAGVPETEVNSGEIRTLFGGKFWSAQTYRAPVDSNSIAVNPDAFFWAKISQGAPPPPPIVPPPVENPEPELNKTQHIAYIQGYPDQTVRPGGDITREETAMIFYRLMTEKSRKYFYSVVSSFPDVEDGRWSAAAIGTLLKAGILKGYGDGSFGPLLPVTRAEFAVIAARFDPEEYEGEDLFPDIGEHWAREEINCAAKAGWVKGDGSGNFRPDDPITRAEAVTLINRALERAPETAEDLLEGMRTFPDNADPNEWYYLAVQEAANGHGYIRKPDGVHESWTDLREN